MRPQHRRPDRPWLPVGILMAMLVWQCVIDQWCWLTGCMNWYQVTATLVLFGCVITVAVVAAWRDDGWS